MRISSFALALPFLVGCHVSSPGQLGHAQFQWTECLVDCAVTDHAMAAAGAHAEIALTLDSGYTVAQVRSTDPSVATFTLGQSLRVEVTSGQPGQTKLQLLDGSGRLVDEIAVNVVATAKLAFKQGWTSSAPIVLEGSPQYFHVTTLDGQGNTLIGTGAVRFDLTGTITPTLAILFGDEVAFTGSAGSGTITASTPTVTVVLPVEVVPLSALTGVVAHVSGYRATSTGYFADVATYANSADGAVYGASCSWTSNDPSVHPTQVSPSPLEEAAASTTAIRLDSPGSFSASCTIGSQSTTVMLQR
jgi:hypothetical protein